jgi:hypothetical protein
MTNACVSPTDNPVTNSGHNNIAEDLVSVVQLSLTAILGVPLFDEEHVFFRPPVSWIDGARRNAF